MTIPLVNQSHASDQNQRPRRKLLHRIESTATPADEGVDFDSVLRHLRQCDGSDGLTVLDALQGAISEAERRSLRTLRSLVTRTVHYVGWAYEMQCPAPPLQSITSVKYYDYSDTLQTLASLNYAAAVSTDGVGRVLFNRDFSFPNLNPNRQDPVQIEMVTGYGSAAAIPGVAKTAIRLFAEAIYDGNPNMRAEAISILQTMVFRGGV